MMERGRIPCLHVFGEAIGAMVVQVQNHVHRSMLCFLSAMNQSRVVLI